MGDSSIDFFLETLKHLITSSELNSIINEKRQFQFLEKEIKYLGGFLKDTEKKRNEHSEVMKLVMDIRDVVSNAEIIIERFVIDAFKVDHLYLNLEIVKKDIRDVVVEAENIIKQFVIDASKAIDHLSLDLVSVEEETRDVISEVENIVVKFVIDDFKAYNHSLDLESVKEDIRDVVCDAENIIEQFLIDAFKANNLSLDLEIVKKKIRDVVAEAENIIVQFVIDAFKVYHLSLDLESVKKEIKTLTAKVKQIYDENIYDINEVAVKKFKHSSTRSGGGLDSSRGSNTSKVVKENVVVGFDNEVKTILEKLDDRRKGRPLEIITIIGIGGGGKTTLAREVFHHPLTSHTFKIRAWLHISQDYDKTKKKDLLICILKSAFPENHEDYKKSSEDKLGEKVRKCLMGRKFLIVMDDIWDIEAWNDIQRSYPNERMGSKVLFTSRQLVQPDNVCFVPHYLNPLPRRQSWELLQHKVFRMNCCPPELVNVGVKIAEKCEGLPLAIVAIGGILAAKDKTLAVWVKVAKHLSSIIAKNKEAGCMEILELSYNLLPLHLKACFLYIGAFLDNSEIRVRELLWLWIAEGFIQQSEGGKCLEDVAKGHLIDLIDRSLVMVARKSSLGGIKACRIHDLLRVFCLKKAEEDNFFVRICKDGSFSPSTTNKVHRLFIDIRFFEKFFSGPRARNLRSILYLRPFQFSRSEQNMSFFAENFDRVRVLSIFSFVCGGPIRMGHLVHLRYLATRISLRSRWWLESISNLWNLETLDLNVDHGFCIQLPCDMFKMVKLRHLYTKNGIFTYHFSSEEVARVGFDHSSKLDSLQTLHTICACKACRRFLVRTPNLRKLGLKLRFFYSSHLNLKFLTCLENLSLSSFTLTAKMKLPPTVKRLTLKCTLLKWEEMSILQNLPSLEVLKLKAHACEGPVWNTSEGGFSQLKYLSFDEMYQIEEWNASEKQFPRLEVLVLKGCTKLKEIPIDFVFLDELREIKLEWCSRSVEESARMIQEERRNKNEDDDCLNLIVKSN